MKNKIKAKIVALSFNIYDYLIIAAMIIMFVPTFNKLYHIGWKSADYDHAIFILPIAIWLIYRKKEELIRADSLNLGGIALFVFGVLSYMYAALTDVMFLEAISFVVVFWSVFKIRFTGPSVKKILFPLIYLVFLIPPPSLVIDTITLPLKTISTYGSYLLLKILHLPVQVFGAVIKVGSHELFMADACSGFRSMVTLLALGSLYAYLQDTSIRKKWIIFLTVIPLGIAGNILRITLMGFIAYFIGMKYAEGFFHSMSGLMLFLFTIIGLMGVSALVMRRRKDV